MTTATQTKRPDLRDYFRGRIDWHVNGMMAQTVPLPKGVRRVVGDVTHHEFYAELEDGTRFYYEGGNYSTRKRNGCYAPLMPKPVERPCYTCDSTGKAARGWSGNYATDGQTCPDCNGTGTDQTRYGTGSDNCAHCGSDWKQAHDEGCVAA